MTNEERMQLLYIVHLLNKKSNMYFWGSVLCLVAFGISVYATLAVESRYIFMMGIFFILARFVLMPKGMAYNMEARKILNQIPD